MSTYPRRDRAAAQPYTPKPTHVRVPGRIGRPPNSARIGRPPLDRSPAPGSAPGPSLPTPAPARQPQAQVYFRAATHPEGPLPLYLPPPGQPTLDPTFRQPPRSQAMYSTYPSRMATGVTSLLQPDNIQGGPRERAVLMAEYEKEMLADSGVSTPRDSPAPAPTPGVPRGRKRVNYAEQGSESESSLSEPDEPASDPEDLSYAGGARGRRREDFQASARAGRLKKKKDELNKGWTWLGERAPGERVKSTPMHTKRAALQSEDALALAADTPEMLVPISIDLEVSDGLRLKDRFLWNINDPNITPRTFAETLTADLSLSTSYNEPIAELISAQVADALAVAEIDVYDRDVHEDEVDFDEEPEAVEDDVEYVQADQRVIINLDVQIYTQVLRDRIEWDLSSPLPPAHFAVHYARELGLSGEAAPLIAHAITDEILKHKKDALDLRLFRATHPEEQGRWEKTPGQPRVTSRTGARGLVGVWRDWWERDEFGPVLVDLGYEEMERREMDRVREARRAIRGVMGKRRR